MRPILQQWVDMLRDAELPVLSHTVTELARLRTDEDNANPQRIANVVLHDPIMTLKMLQYLQAHSGKRRNADITTIAHALMMLGMSPFFQHFGQQSTIESRFAGDAVALHGMLAVMSRARHAALYARDWAQLRFDVDPEEVMIAALLHDMAEMLLWCFAPPLALEIAERQRKDPALRSDTVQQAVLGFQLIDLQLEMIKAWRLPQLLHVLSDEHHMLNPRVLNVAQATALARHSSHSWGNRALPHDYAVIGELLVLSEDEAEQRVLTVAVEAAAEWQWYGVEPPAIASPWPAPTPTPAPSGAA
jgi:HD-like signal output (HDOD) protein